MAKKKAIVLSVDEEHFKKIIGEYPSSQRELNEFADIIETELKKEDIQQIWNKIHERCRKIIALNKLRETKTKQKTIKRRIK